MRVNISFRPTRGKCRIGNVKCEAGHEIPAVRCDQPCGWRRLRQRSSTTNNGKVVVEDGVHGTFTDGKARRERYNLTMARGWDSKSVEAQIEESDSSSSSSPDGVLSAEDLQTEFKKKDLLLSRRRVLQQLESSNNERYSDLLRRTLVDLDIQIASLN
jgi:hypothetical protein